MGHILRIKGLTQQFGGLIALSDINIDVDEGAIVGIIGPNGAGKTTLFNIITGIYSPTKGSIEFLGKDITGEKTYIVTQKGLARTFQNIRLFGKLTTIENVMLGMHAVTKTNIADALFNTKRKSQEQVTCLKDAEKILTLLDLSESKYSMARNLPYGSQRKLEIARALATKPRMLLLDEPAAGMNEQETMELLQTVKKLKGLGYTVLLIEHDMKFVMNICEKIFVIDHGIMIAQGTPYDIQRNPAVIEAYLGKDA